LVQSNPTELTKGQRVKVSECLRVLLVLCEADMLSDKNIAKAQKITIKLPWEILNVYSDVLPDDDEEDEDDIEAHEASTLRLKVSAPNIHTLIFLQAVLRKQMTRQDK
jgi:hypothetical protein